MSSRNIYAGGQVSYYNRPLPGKFLKTGDGTALGWQRNPRTARPDSESSALCTTKANVPQSARRPWLSVSPTVPGPGDRAPAPIPARALARPPEPSVWELGIGGAQQEPHPPPPLPPPPPRPGAQSQILSSPSAAAGRGGAGGGAQTAGTASSSEPPAQLPWGRGWGGGPDPRRARKPGRRRGAVPRPLSAGCAGSARSSPCSVSGGRSAPGSCCGSCARREKERAGRWLEAGEGPGAAGCGPGRGGEVLRSWPRAREAGLAPDCVRGPGGFRREGCDRLKGFVWARRRGSKSNGLGWRPARLRGWAGGCECGDGDRDSSPPLPGWRGQLCVLREPQTWS